MRLLGNTGIICDFSLLVPKFLYNPYFKTKERGILWFNILLSTQHIVGPRKYFSINILYSCNFKVKYATTCHWIFTAHETVKGKALLCLWVEKEAHSGDLLPAIRVFDSTFFLGAGSTQCHSLPVLPLMVNMQSEPRSLTPQSHARRVLIHWLFQSTIRVSSHNEAQGEESKTQRRSCTRS